MVNLKRVRILKAGNEKKGPVVYWMGRDQRTHDNWAILYAQQEALVRKVPLCVVFCLVPSFLDATLRQYQFMLDGLGEVFEKLSEKDIPFYFLKGEPFREIPKFVKKIKASILVADFEPLRIRMKWKDSVSKKISIPFYEVDARNIVPCWVASKKQEFGAYTIRPKIHKLIDEYLDNFPPLRRHPYKWEKTVMKISPRGMANFLKVDKKVKPVGWIKPGEREALNALRSFVKGGLARYDLDRNKPEKNGQSNLSPYLHFGQLSSQRVVMDVLACELPKKFKTAFIEEIVVRRELSDNFCFYNSEYDNFNGLPFWAKKTLDEHRHDRRLYLYSLKELEEGRTHDNMWNAAQIQMVKTGKMHGYMRMYWAKKILEWSSSPEEAIKTAIYLNDKYELDGRDTNGYAGIMWSMGGVHDRAWSERQIFGKIRFMSYNSTKTKFDYKGYIERVGKM